MAVCAVALCAAAPARSQESTRPGERRRIVERPQRPGVGKKLARVPLYPLIGLGRAFERGLLAVEENRLQQRLTYSQRWLLERGVQPLTGGMGTGTGFALGVRLFDDDFGHPRVRAELPLRYSTNNYQQFEAALGFTLAGSHWDGAERALYVDFFGAYRSRPQEDFFGVGIGSSEDDRTSYHLQDRSAGAVIGTETGPLRAEFGFRHTNANIFRGRDPQHPSIETRFPDLAGLAEGASLLRYGFDVTIEWLDRPLDPHRGFRWRSGFHWVDSLNSSPFDHLDYGATVEGYLPLGRPRTLAVRALAEFREPRGGSEVPFFVLPFLGGASTMRGFREFRFRDRNALLLNVEYRYEIWKYMDFVLFVDQGQVAPRARAFTLDGFRTGYGGGIRVKGKKGVGLRFDVGRSSEGTRFYFTFSPEF